MDEKISAYETEHKLTVSEFQMMGDKDFANPVRHRELYLALVNREAIRDELVQLRAKLSTQEAIVEKLHPRDGYIRRDQVLGYLATLAGLEDADPMQGTVASTVVRNTINAFYDARDAAAEAARDTEGSER